MKGLTPLWTAGPKGSPLLLVRRIYVFPFLFPCSFIDPSLLLRFRERGDGFMLGLLGRLCSLRLNESNHQLWLSLMEIMSLLVLNTLKTTIKFPRSKNCPRASNFTSLYSKKRILVLVWGSSNIPVILRKSCTVIPGWLKANTWNSKSWPWLGHPHWGDFPPDTIIWMLQIN